MTQSALPPRLETPPCPLCGSGGAEPFHDAGAQAYYRCAKCELIYLHPGRRLSAGQERARYLEHRNDPDDPRYEEFLRRLADPMMAQLLPGARGLDFGCGPTQVLAGIFTGAGFPCHSYDPFFHPDEALLAGRYDFVSASEVVEHLFDPAATFERLFGLLEDGGVLGVMTRFYGHEAPFDRWWYRRDPTHVCFYAEPVMQWIARRHGAAVAFPRPHVALFHRR